MDLVEWEYPLEDPFGMNPAQGMEEHIKLPGIITEDHQLRWKAMVDQATDQSAFGGDANMSGLMNSQRFKLRAPGDSGYCTAQ